MVQVIWTELAQLDFDEIFHYYDSFSSKVAISYSEEVIRTTDLLELFPEMGPQEPLLTHLERNYRYVLVFRRYKIIYLFENDVCSIMMVWDCREDPKSLLSSDRFI